MIRDNYLPKSKDTGERYRRISNNCSITEVDIMSELCMLCHLLCKCIDGIKSWGKIFAHFHILP